MCEIHSNSVRKSNIMALIFQHDAMSRKINEVAEELRRSEARNSTLAEDLDAARNAAHQSEQELANTRNRMKDLQAQEALSRNLEQQLQVSFSCY